MKKNILLFWFICLTILLRAENHALLIGVSNYPSDSGWPELSSDNDLRHIKAVLQLHDFSEKNIFLLQNENATYQGIIAAFDELQQKVHVGDIVYIHFSGHGQQVLDDNKDEIDRLDETIVPFDSPKSFKKGVYEGERLIRDDLLNKLTDIIRAKTGINGQVVLVLDSCHSGTGVRGRNRVRGTAVLMAPKKIKVRKRKKQADKTYGVHTVENTSVKLAPMISYFGSTARESNYETFDDQLQPIGSLSYALSSVLGSIKHGLTYEELFDRIMLRMKTLAPKQHPQWEGNNKGVVFGRKNNLVERKGFDVIEITDAQTLKVNIGTISGVHEGTIVEIYSIDQDKILSEGNVIKANLTSSLIKCLNVIAPKYDELLKVRIKTKFNLPNTLAIRYDIAEDSKWSPISSLLKTKQFIQESVCNADLYLHTTQQDNTLFLSKIDGTTLFKSNQLNCENELLQKTRSFAQAKFLKAYNPTTSKYQFSIQLLKANCDQPAKQSSSLKPLKNNKTKVGDCIQIAIKNEGAFPAYFSLLDIQPDHQINLIIPIQGGTKTPDDFYLQPNETYLTDFVIDVYEPIGEETLKLICTDQPLHLAPLIATRGNTSRGSNDLHPFEVFFIQTFQTNTRSNNLQPVGLDEVGVCTLFFEIER